MTNVHVNQGHPTRTNSPPISYPATKMASTLYTASVLSHTLSRRSPRQLASEQSPSRGRPLAVGKRMPAPRSRSLCTRPKAVSFVGNDIATGGDEAAQSKMERVLERVVQGVPVRQNTEQEATSNRYQPPPVPLTVGGRLATHLCHVLNQAPDSHPFATRADRGVGVATIRRRRFAELDQATEDVYAELEDLFFSKSGHVIPQAERQEVDFTGVTCDLTDPPPAHVASGGPSVIAA
eukprot:1178836-Prorocentrum_minimum.AAC.2